MGHIFTDRALPPRWQSPLSLVMLWCLCLLGYGLYLQHVDGLIPCPMCIVQRYALVLLLALAGVGLVFREGWFAMWWQCLGIVVALGGAFTAARQSWLQWYPPEILACGRDFYGMIEAFPLQRVIPMLFKGSGDCSAVDWSFLGLTIANWSFLNFVLLAVVWVRVLRTTYNRNLKAF